MNQGDRDKLAAIIKRLSDDQSTLETLAEDEQEKFDNLSEGLQGGEKGQLIEAAATALDSAQEALQGVIDELEGIE